MHLLALRHLVDDTPVGLHGLVGHRPGVDLLEELLAAGGRARVLQLLEDRLDRVAGANELLFFDGLHFTFVVSTGVARYPLSESTILSASPSDAWSCIIDLVNDHFLSVKSFDQPYREFR